MTSQQILQSDLVDILFENRNKEYGAYSLRKMYQRELIKAIGLTGLLVFALVFFANQSPKAKAQLQVKEAYELTAVTLPEEKKMQPIKPKISSPAASAPVKQLQLSSDVKMVDQTTTAVASQQDLQTALVGSTTIAGPPLTGIPEPPLLISGPGIGKGEVLSAPKDETPLPSRSPQFPGGTSAWLNFLNKHLHPPADLEAGEKRASVIRFSVDEEGTITNFQILQSGGTEFDNEVIRVLKKMPKWLPALQNGKPIAVSFTQPVTFIAPEG